MDTVAFESGPSLKKNGRGSSEVADELLRPELKGREVAGVAVARAVDVLHGPVLWAASCVQHTLHVLCQPAQVRMTGMPSFEAEA